ncbi:MAG TPA: NAD-dependent epimerase/dehydratase family protein, partial [Gaiellales bacterium]|nr:NAD-dependent epimerase/dehydratase family protein [Gaiellales bacterium]
GRRELVHPAARIHRGDVRSRAATALVARLRPAIVVHAAAQASVPRSLAEPLHDAAVNVLGSLRLLEASARHRVGVFVYISTGGAAYGDTAPVPTREESPLKPMSPYGVSKVSAEHYVACFSGLAGMRAVTLRLANVYGPRQNAKGEAGVVAIFATRMLRGEPCVINGDGRQTRDFVYVGDVAEAVRCAAEDRHAAGAVNIGTGRQTTINALYRRVAGAVGVRRPARHGPARSGEQRRSALAPDRARRLIGWRPVTPIDVGVRLTVEYFRRGRAR